MSSVTIAKLGRIASLGLFQSCPATNQPQFRQHNLIYGFNGSGKTTLSRIIASLGTGARCPSLPTDGTFEIHLSNGAIQSSSGEFSALRGRVHVFNTDFIEENFLWKEGEARPVFYIGKAQAELSQKLAQVAADIASRTEDLAQTGERLETVTRAFTSVKRDLARAIADHLGLGRKYDATNLVADYSNKPEEGFHSLREDELLDLKSVLAQTAPHPKLEEIQLPQPAMTVIVDRLRELAGMTPGEMVLKDLQGHDSMRQWLGEGLRYHKKQKLGNCLFCGGTLKENRIADLETVIDDTFSRLVENLESAHEDLEALISEYKDVRSALPRSAEFDSHLRDRAIACIRDAKESFTSAEQILSGVAKMMADKIARPHKVPEGLESNAQVQVKQASRNASSALAKLNGLIEEHNSIVDQFLDTKAEAAAKIKSHLLHGGESSFTEAQTSLESLKAEKGDVENSLTQLRRSEESLKRAVRTHGPAADVITRMIHNYLGRGDLELVAAEEGYRLRRNGKLVKGSLSEGERTAIAICYFLTTLEAEGRKRKDLIVVVDDPVSSLDTRALNYSFNVIQAVVKDTAQTFLITHNLQFMREAKNWLHPKTESGLDHRGKDPSTASATLLFLDTVQPGGPETRNCILKEMPKHIRDYESEYHYLFHLILQFIASPADTQHFYLLPNALRKILDVFLAFKLPGPQGLGSKIDKVAATIESMDPARIRALERLAQVESHADTLDELVAFSTTTVEEVHQAAETLLAFMGKLDADHLESMRRLCT